MSLNECIQYQPIMDEFIQQLFVLEKAFFNFYNFMKKELIKQKDWIKRMCVISQRYVLILSTGPCCKFPDVYPNPTTERLLQEIAEKIRNIRLSNCTLNNALNELRKACLTFEKLCHQMNNDNLVMAKTPLVSINGVYKHEATTHMSNQLTFHKELIKDLFQYLHAWTLKLTHSAHLIEPSNFQYLNVYNDLLQTSEDFEEYFTKSLTHCKCLQKTKKINRYE